MTSLRDQQAGRDAASFDDDRKEGRYDRARWSADGAPETPTQAAEDARLQAIHDDVEAKCAFMWAGREAARQAVVTKAALFLNGAAA
jgi:hypothetical protein